MSMEWFNHQLRHKLGFNARFEFAGQEVLLQSVEQKYEPHHSNMGSAMFHSPLGYNLPPRYLITMVVVPSNTILTIEGDCNLVKAIMQKLQGIEDGDS